MNSASDEQNALTGGVEPVQCFASRDDEKYADSRQQRQPGDIETFLELLASVALAVAARQSDLGQGIAE